MTVYPIDDDVGDLQIVVVQHHHMTKVDKLRASINRANIDRPESKRLQHGPFYALGPVKTWVLVAPLGLCVNNRFEVLTPEGVVIPGLYAVGHAGMGGFTMTGHGHGLGWAFTSGRLAAGYAASRLEQAESGGPE